VPSEPPPEPPARTEEQPGRPPGGPIEDMREAFERKAPHTDEDQARTRTFIQGKIEMIRRDPYLTDEQKAAAIAELEGKLPPP